jgi:hypothetical protein
MQANFYEFSNIKIHLYKTVNVRVKQHNVAFALVSIAKSPNIGYIVL